MYCKPRRLALPLALSLLTPMLAVAADEVEPIATDRPDFVESSLTVGRSVFQIETSVARERNTRKHADETMWSTPTLLRYGVSDDVELRLETDAFTWTRSKEGGSSSTERGFSDSSLGVKWHVLDGDEHGRPSVGLLFHVDLNSGSSAFRRNAHAPSIRAVAEWELPKDMSLGVMAGVVADKDDDGDRFASGILAATVGKAFTERWRGFVELAGRSLTKSEYGGNVVTLDLGTAYYIDADTQIDAAVELGANDNTPNHAWTIGISHRFR